MASKVSIEDPDRISSTDLLPLEAPPPAVFERLRVTLAQSRAELPTDAPVDAGTDCPRAGPSHVRPLRSALCLTLPAVVLIVLALDALLRGRGLWRSDAGSLAQLAVPVLTALALAVVATALSLSRGQSGLGERVGVQRAVALGVAPLSLVPMFVLARASVEPAGHVAELHHPWGLPCMVTASAIAGASLWLFVRTLKQTVPVALGARSAALGSAAAAWAGLALLVHCASVEPTHLLLGHWLPLCTFPLVGLVAARRSLAL